jgi:myo-inositol-1(or 4)-monophosphatase
VLIVNEAGGKTTDFKNRPFRDGMNQILATNGHIHPEMIPLLKLKDDQ